jgi:hypothetical protein
VPDTHRKIGCGWSVSSDGSNGPQGVSGHRLLGKSSAWALSGSLMASPWTARGGSLRTGPGAARGIGVGQAVNWGVHRSGVATGWWVAGGDHCGWPERSPAPCQAQPAPWGLTYMSRSRPCTGQRGSKKAWRLSNRRPMRTRIEAGASQGHPRHHPPGAEHAPSAPPPARPIPPTSNGGSGGHAGRGGRPSTGI